MRMAAPGFGNRGADGRGGQKQMQPLFPCPMRVRWTVHHLGHRYVSGACAERAIRVCARVGHHRCSPPRLVLFRRSSFLRICRSVNGSHFLRPVQPVRPSSKKRHRSSLSDEGAIIPDEFVRNGHSSCKRFLLDYQLRKGPVNAPCPNAYGAGVCPFYRANSRSRISAERRISPRNYSVLSPI